MLKGLLIFCISFLCLGSFYGQSRIGSWEDHLSLNNCISVCKLNGKIYASSYSSIIIYNETDQSIEKINKINGLSDVGIHLMRENPYNNRILVLYENSNIDIVQPDNTIINYSDIYSKNISGKKNVNEALFSGKMAYLACGFGIALFDTEKLEIKDTYIIGPGGSNLEVFQIAMDDSLMYAATPNGLLKCNYKTQILNDYHNWVLVSSSLPAGYYSNVINFNNTILTTYSPYKQSGLSDQDTVYQFTGNNWSKFASLTPPYTIKKIKQTTSCLNFINQYGSIFFDANLALLAYVTSYDNHTAYPSDIYTDGKVFWIADLYNGLIKTTGSSPFYKPTYIHTNGIDLNFISNLDVHNGIVALSPMLIDNGGGATFSKEAINIDNDGVWSYLRNENSPADSITDYCAVMLDRKDPSRMWASSWVFGLVEFKNNSVLHVYNGNNTGGAMEAILPNWWRCSGLDMDDDGNLFFALSDVPHYLSVKKTNGTFQNFLFDGTARFVRKVHCDKNGQVWILHERDQGLTVCKINKTSPNFSVEAFKILDANVGTGNLESNSVFSIVEDLDGKIWVGTAAGVRVFNSPNTILTGGQVDGDEIKIVQDGNVELLLERETVTCIDVDAGNNKWIGTAASGVFCFSPDGQHQLFHFTAETDPLYSDQIIDLKYNGATGDIFIGTNIGLQSFKNVVKDGSTDFSTIFTYPNPVKPSYTGNVYVSGLVDQSIVKIADEAGNFVWETKSQGGRIEWPLKTFANNRVPSGVYTIYAATTTAELKAVSKVLVVN
jgi:hypothetical protein